MALQPDPARRVFLSDVRKEMTMTDEELVEKVARGLCSRVLSDIEIADSAEAVIDNSWRAYVADAETALAIARHIIEREALEKADIIKKLKKWFEFQSELNTVDLYNACAKLFGAKFDPTEYDDVP